MKKVLLSTILFLGMSPAYAWNNSVAEMAGGISEGRTSVEASIVNRVNVPILCRDVTVDIAYENQGQMIIARKQYNLARAYIEKHETKTWQVGADEHQRLLEKNEYVFVRDFEVSVGSCEPASLVDYCNHAVKSDGEVETLQKIMNATKAGSCEAVEAAINKRGRLGLSGAKIFNLKPVSFLTGLRELDISNNVISSIAELAPLRQLTKLNVSYNELLTEIDAVVNLPYIEKIDAGNTGLKYKNWTKISPKLLKRGALIIDRTPYAEELTRKSQGRGR